MNGANTSAKASVVQPAEVSAATGAAQPGPIKTAAVSGATGAAPPGPIQPAGVNGATAAAQPGAYQSLKMLLSKQCAKIGKFKVIVYKPWPDTYTYQWEGKERKTNSLALHACEY